jgi:isoleucyl-tRNA synthetase
MAPILPFTSEEVWQHMPAYEGKKESIHLEDQVTVKPEWRNADLAKTWETIIEVRGDVTKALELARVKKLIGHPLDASVAIQAEGDYRVILEKYQTILKEIFIVSSATLLDGKPGNAYESETIAGLSIVIDKAPGTKCERCWTYDVTTGNNPVYENACTRCCTALEEIGPS